MIVQSEVVVGSKTLGKRACLPLRVVCFVAVFISAGLGDAAAVEFTGVGAREEDEMGDEMAG